MTIAGARTDISSKHFIDLSKWNNQRQKVTGSSEDVRSINSELKELEISAYKAHGEMTNKKLPITSWIAVSFVKDCSTVDMFPGLIFEQSMSI